MIKIEAKKQDNKVKQIKIKGHALYDEYGKDIVCASVSSIVITTVNAISLIDNNAIKVSQNNGVTIDIIKEDIITDKLINNMINLLDELSKDYPENIKFL